MIRTLRRKFIAVTMLAVFLVLTAIMVTLNIANYRAMMSDEDAVLERLAEGGGTFFGRGVLNVPDGNPPDGTNAPSETGEPNGSNAPSETGEPSGTNAPSGRGKPSDDGETRIPRQKQNWFGRDIFNEETPFNTRYFSVTFDENGDVTAINLENIAAVSESGATDIAETLFANGKAGGFYETYKYVRTETDDGTQYIFLDCTEDIDKFYGTLLISVLVSVLGLLLVFALVVIFSKIVVRPIAESYEKQKRFITDASHEIKTPLAIIDANTEVIELESGETEWTRSTKHQIARLTSLTEKLVFLSRMEEEGTHLEPTDFSLSDAVSETAEGFLSVAEASAKTLEINVADGMICHGDEAMIRQAVSLLCDNALKYASENGTIRVTLKKSKSGKHSIITVWNTVDEIEKGNLDILFERFYRNDTSRSTKTGGHGIGLSVVQAIVKQHKGKVSAESSDGKSIQFEIIL